MTEAEPVLELAALSHRYNDVEVLVDIHLQVGAGEIVCLLGPSGCGKSTLLRLIAGLEPIQAGAIRFAGADFARPGAEPAPESRRFGLVFQDHALFPHLTVADNVGFGLSALSRQERQNRVGDQLSRVGLAGFADRFPHTLSGGQQQRVALVRALATEPRLMLLDEPFASVDATLRRRLREETRAVLKASNVPSIVVTHDADEALELGDRIAVMNAGRIVQCDVPEAIWRKPSSRFVAELFSDTSTIEAWREGDQLVCAFGALPIAVPDGLADRCDVLARPESLQLQRSEAGPAVVEDVRFLGSRYLVRISAGGDSLRWVTPVAPDLAPGDQVAVTFAPDQTVAYT